MIYKLKGLFLVLFGICISLTAYTQINLSHNSGWFYIEENENVFVKGNIISLDSNPDPIVNLGQMYITDTVSCFGTNKIFGSTPDTLTGNVFLIGDKLQIFAGNQNIRFGNLYIQNTFDSLILHTNVDVFNFLQLDLGNVYISDYKTLDFLSTGRLINESNSHRIFGNNYGQLHLVRPLINGNTYHDIAGFGLDLSINGNLGVYTHIWRKNVQQVNVSNGSIDRFFYFQPENSGFVSNPVIHYLDTIELHNNLEDSLSIYLSKSFGNNWTEEGGVTNSTLDKTSSDAGYTLLLNTQTMLTLAEGACNNPPYLHFEKDTIPLCNYNPAYLNPDGISGMSSVWNNGILNKDSIQVTTPGVYKVTVTDINGCPASDSIVVIAAPNPVVDFSVPPVCIGDSTSFTNLTQITSGTIDYRWNFNDPYTAGIDTSSIKDPVFGYQNQGSFSVSLEATSNYGCTNTLSKQAVVNPYPMVNFSVAHNCQDSILLINNSTLIMPNDTISYLWNFGDGQTSNDHTPVHSFANEGSYQITLQATSKMCTSEDSLTIVVYPNPVAQFSASDVCLNTATQFSNATTIASGSASYLWDMDNGNSSVLNNPAYTYTAAGDYHVKLTAVSDKGCTNDTSILVKVFPLPNPTFSTLPTCMNASMQFVNHSDSSSTFVWNFNGLGTSNDYEPNFIWNSSGNQSVYVQETDSNGCSYTGSQSVVVKPKPFADFVQVEGCEKEGISFLNASSTPSGTLTYLWDFGDNTSSNLSSPVHSYNTFSTYNVKLLANNDGCLDSITKTVTIHPKPVLNFGGQISTCADSLTLDAQNPGSTFLWSNMSTSQSIQVNYGGQYSVEITSNKGCVHRDTVMVVLNSVVSPSLGEDSVFCSLANLSAGYPGSTYLWSTGDTTQSISINMSDTLWVEVTDQNGCVGYDTIAVGVAIPIIPNLGTDLDKCFGESTLLYSNQPGNSYHWSTGADQDTIMVNSSGTYWIELRDSNQCISYDTVVVTYHPNPTLNLGIDTNYCDSAFFDISQPNVSFLWDDASAQATRVITSNGSYWARLTDLGTGCQTTDSVTITISSTPLFNLGLDTVLCSGSQIVLNTGYPGFNTTWNTGDTGQYLTVSSSGLYTANVESNLGCVAHDTINIAVRSPLNPYLGSDFILCSNSIAEVSSPINNASYTWTLNDTLLPDTTQSVFVSQNGELVCQVVTTDGCTAVDTLNLLATLSETNANFLVATQNVYTDDTIQFVNLTYPAPYTSSWDFGDGYYSMNNNPTHVYDNEGIYTVLLQVDNGVCTDTISKSIEVVQGPSKRITTNRMDQILGYKLYPNPNDGVFSLEVELNQESEIEICLFDMLGREVVKEARIADEFTIVYNLPQLKPGLYVIRLSTYQQTKVIKFIKK
jgi:PKD repeat protein